MALDVVGERWSMLVIRELLLGPRRFGVLLAALDGIGPNLLTVRLRALEAQGIVVRSRPAYAGHDVYRLTQRGLALEPALLELAAWGAELLGEPVVDGRFDVGWMLLSLKRRYRRTPRPFQVGLSVDGRSFTLGLGDEHLTVVEQEAVSPAVHVAADGLTLADVLYRGASLGAAVARGALQVEGDPALVIALRRAVAGPSDAP